jgi:hypothetical protein
MVHPDVNRRSGRLATAIAGVDRWLYENLPGWVRHACGRLGRALLWPATSTRMLHQDSSPRRAEDLRSARVRASSPTAGSTPAETARRGSLSAPKTNSL